MFWPHYALFLFNYFFILKMEAIFSPKQLIFSKLHAVATNKTIVRLISVCLNATDMQLKLSFESGI
jgi:hypothetical protein